MSGVGFINPDATWTSQLPQGLSTTGKELIQSYSGYFTMPMVCLNMHVAPLLAHIQTNVGHIHAMARLGYCNCGNRNLCSGIEHAVKYLLQYDGLASALDRTAIAFKAEREKASRDAARALAENDMLRQRVAQLERVAAPGPQAPMPAARTGPGPAGENRCRLSTLGTKSIAPPPTTLKT
jgi:hypothetical protein